MADSTSAMQLYAQALCTFCHGPCRDPISALVIHFGNGAGVASGPA